MIMEECEFGNVEMGSLEPNACSPMPPDDDFTGILIRAPKRVMFGEDADFGGDAFTGIPICGYYMLDAASLPAEDDIVEAMRLVARDTKTGEEYSGRILDPSPKAPPPFEETRLSRDEFEGLSAGGYFNPNLGDYVALPRHPAVYDVFVELGEIKSDVVSIEVVEES